MTRSTRDSCDVGSLASVVFVVPCCVPARIEGTNDHVPASQDDGDDNDVKPTRPSRSDWRSDSFSVYEYRDPWPKFISEQSLTLNLSCDIKNYGNQVDRESWYLHRDSRDWTMIKETSLEHAMILRSAPSCEYLKLGKRRLVDDWTFVAFYNWDWYRLSCYRVPQRTIEITWYYNTCWNNDNWWFAPWDVSPMKEIDRRVDDRDEAKCEGTGNANADIKLFRYVARRRVERRSWLLTEYRPKTVATELVVAKVAHKRVHLVPWDLDQQPQKSVKGRLQTSTFVKHTDDYQRTQPSTSHYFYKLRENKADSRSCKVFFLFGKNSWVNVVNCVLSLPVTRIYL